jgi:pimeloyl-ACP methyl ester carboxylesterase
LLFHRLAPKTNFNKLSAQGMKLQTKPLLTITAVILTAAIILSRCISFEVDPITVIDSNGKPAIEQTVQLDQTALHYLESGNSAGTVLVFIHGTPGSMGFFSGYITDPRLTQTRNITIDRPGWGKSIVNGPFDPTLTFQSAALGNWLCDIKQASPNNKLVVVAHSYGATLTPKLAMDHPQCISAALLLAGGADPKLTAPRWYNNLAHYPPVSWLVSLFSMDLKRSNNEMMSVKTELEKIQLDWQKLKLPITVIQGEEDGLVHPDNADFIETQLAHIPAKIIRVEGAGHVLRESHRDLIMDEILNLL